VRELSLGVGTQAFAVNYGAFAGPGPGAGASAPAAGAGLRGLSLPSLVAGEQAPGVATALAVAAAGAAR
jgi:hypothetical protein